MKNLAKRVAWAFIGALLLIGFPLVGVRLTGSSLAPYLQMPPRTDFVQHSPFSWPVFLGMALMLALIVGPFLIRMLRARSKIVNPEPAAPFPLWGWLGLAAGVAIWILAWTRFSWFTRFQPFTFTPLWLCYIVVMNALVFRRTGKSPLTHETCSYLMLFLISALFWWFFEYLNRFVQNWHYVGISPLTAWEYFWRATLPFSTVLPAFVATRAWLAGYPCMWAGLSDWKSLTVSRPGLLAWILLAASAVGLAAIGIWHEFLFPLLWISPGIVIACLRTLNDEETLFSDLKKGDWRRLAQAALAALVCGLFWETWNFYSLEKWIYTVPFVDRFRIFEMPILGFAGYLPFGIECALISDWVGLTGKDNS